ncbi:MAG TPA: YbhB/YbcL family Raf kinase inhibitor-like protein [Desulfomonilia bacterium]|nr:YbhB/YbcL family Raf kinase inhibitor-like protein [Desulfomonilia bacterium]
MKKFKIIAVILLGAFLVSAAYAGDFKLKSPELNQGKRLNMEQVFSSFGCSGKNISPALTWEGAPKNTKSFAVTVYDPDAPTGSGWWHWVIYNIPANVSELAKNAGDPPSGLAPQGCIQSRTDFGTPGYGGACPPTGDKPHRYQFTVYALDIDKLPLDANASGAMVGFYLHQHTLAKANITVYFSR